MRRSSVPLWLLLVLPFAGAGCGGDDDGGTGGDADSDADADGDAGGDADTGSLEVVGPWTDADTSGAPVNVAVFECPFTMPPSKFVQGSIEDGVARVLVPGLAPGPWCVLAYIDMDTTDGLKPVNGVDAQAYPGEGQQSFEVAIAAGKTTTLEVTFEIRAE